MNPSTASGRLVKDILFKFVTDAGYVCYQCGEPLTRETFSIEHKTPWLDSEDPIGLYFSMDNIDYSHKSCNSGAARRNKAECGTRSAYQAGCRCEGCTNANRDSQRKLYSKEKRSERYVQTGY